MEFEAGVDIFFDSFMLGPVKGSLKRSRMFGGEFSAFCADGCKGEMIGAMKRTGCCKD